VVVFVLVFDGVDVWLLWYSYLVLFLFWLVVDELVLLVWLVRCWYLLYILVFGDLVCGLFVDNGDVVSMVCLFEWVVLVIEYVVW